MNRSASEHCHDHGVLLALAGIRRIYATKGNTSDATQASSEVPNFAQEAQQDVFLASVSTASTLWRTEVADLLRYPDIEKDYFAVVI